MCSHILEDIHSKKKKNSKKGREAAIKELVENHPSTIQFYESLEDEDPSLET